MRPVMAEPQPLCTLHELRTVYSLNDLYDFHEALDLRETLARKASDAAARGDDDR